MKEIRLGVCTCGSSGLPSFYDDKQYRMIIIRGTN